MNIDRAFDLCQVAVAKEDALEARIRVAQSRAWKAKKRVIDLKERLDGARARNATAYARYTSAAKKLATEGAGLAISSV